MPGALGGPGWSLTQSPCEMPELARSPGSRLTTDGAVSGADLWLGGVISPGARDPPAAQARRADRGFDPPVVPPALRPQPGEIPSSPGVGSPCPLAGGDAWRRFADNRIRSGPGSPGPDAPESGWHQPRRWLVRDPGATPQPGTGDRCAARCSAPAEGPGLPRRLRPATA